MKKILSTILALSFALVSDAAPLSPRQALQRIKINTATRMSSSEPERMKLVYSEFTADGNPAVYVFDDTGNGFFVLSGDDIAEPLLGYSPTGHFNIDAIPPQLKWWISEYATQIRQASNNGYRAKQKDSFSSGNAEIPPILKTIWDQGTPFNDMCPEVNGKKCPTGCVATAMAQLMKHWNYPESGTGRVTATFPPGATGSPFMRLDNMKFDWENMLDSYNGQYSTQQANAVATLMKACGYAASMNYDVDGSGAATFNSAFSFSKNFKYNRNIQCLERRYFNSSLWKEIIYDELAAGRPVMYGGQSVSVGHSFVCDGYDGNGYFHFNWGWGGMSDGYFLLDALNPDAVGTGGGEGGGFNSSQDIIIGIQPTETGFIPRLVQWGNLTASMSGLTLNLSVDRDGSVGPWLNTGITDINVNLGVRLSSVGDNSYNDRFISLAEVTFPAITIIGGNISYSGIDGTASIPIPADLTDGRYKVTVCSRSSLEPDSEWVPVLTTAGAYNYVYLTKDGNLYTVDNMTESELTIENAQFATPVYLNKACRLQLSVKNNSEQEMTGGFYPVLFKDGKEEMFAEGITLTLNPGESKETDFLTYFELIEGAEAPLENSTYTLRFLKDAGSDEYYEWSMPVTILVNPGPADISVTDFYIPDSETRKISIDITQGGQLHQKEVEAFEIVDASELSFCANITNVGTFFASDIYTLIFPGNLSGSNIDALRLNPTPVLTQGESAKVTGNLAFTEGKEGECYAAAIFYVEGGRLQQAMSAPTIFFTVGPYAAVSEIENEDNETYTIYNMQGISVGTDFDSLPAGLYIRNGKKIIKYN